MYGIKTLSQEQCNRIHYSNKWKYWSKPFLVYFQLTQIWSVTPLQEFSDARDEVLPGLTDNEFWGSFVSLDLNSYEAEAELNDVRRKNAELAKAQMKLRPCVIAIEFYTKNRAIDFTL